MSSDQKTITLNQILERAKTRVPEGTIWKHYKGGVYKIYDHVILTEDGSVGIEYYRIDGPGFNANLEYGIHFVRPVKEWFDVIEIEDDIHPVYSKQRFEQVKSKSVWVPVDEA